MSLIASIRRLLVASGPLMALLLALIMIAGLVLGG